MANNPVTTAMVFAAVASVVALGVFRIMGTREHAADIIGACVVGALASMIPTVGGPASLLVMLGVLYWRRVAELRDIAIAVAVARLAMVPALLALRVAH